MSGQAPNILKWITTPQNWGGGSPHPLTQTAPAALLMDTTPPQAHENAHTFIVYVGTISAVILALFLQLCCAVPTLFLQFCALFLGCSSLHLYFPGWLPVMSKPFLFIAGRERSCVLRGGEVAVFMPCCKCCQGGQAAVLHSVVCVLWSKISCMSVISTLCTVEPSLRCSYAVPEDCCAVLPLVGTALV